MIVMKEHDWFDDNIYEVRAKNSYTENAKIICIDSRASTVFINKYDAINLAKEFNLVVYEKDSQL